MSTNLVTVREAAITAVRIGKQWRIPMNDLPGRGVIAFPAETTEETVNA
ncbi:MAG: hypothetical protein JRG82_15015 [Deltaproteobacteria bacterium]|nr:hypothetical protein [Deltaproteobacteria bacterium]